MIVRSADFYGSGDATSVTHATVTARLQAHRRPQWLGNPKAVHTFTYTPDAARTVALLANTATAFGQVWHALTSHEPMTGEQFIRMACELSGRPYRLQVVPRWMLSLLGVFLPLVRENVEMLYQFECDYRFDSGKLERAFSLNATSYREGIAAMLNESATRGRRA
jgi:nucleoside-diphosphate-sugar epimerase